MEKTAWLFPGQGSQSVGMGEDFYREFDFVREIFDMVAEITKIHVSKLCFKGPEIDANRAPDPDGRELAGIDPGVDRHQMASKIFGRRTA